jgi:hypothetical protein
MNPAERARMREAVAVAMYVVTGGQPPWPYLQKVEQDDFLVAADVAILTMEAYMPALGTVH